MFRFALALVFLGVASIGASPLNYLPTKSGDNKTPELFWFQNDDGVILPALLHGKPSHFESKGIAEDVQFYLYNSKNPSATPVEISPGCWSCMTSFVRGAPVVILAHGFSSSHQGGFGNGLRTNFALAPEEMNLIFVNWERLAAAPWYEFAADSTKPVGEWTAQLIEFIVAGEFASISDFTFAGHSLGSHISNFIAHNMTSLRLPRIHALDPALPLFGERDDTQRIDPSDADFVNVIHTAMGTLLDGGLAFTEPRGHVDFYPNSGKNQPNCGGDFFGACSHSRAHEYFGESVHRRNGFVSCECQTWEDYVNGCDCTNSQNMGWSTPETARGIFYLRTNGVPPFGIGA